MKKLLKLLLLLLLNISVYFIYNSTKNSVYTITSLGDGVSLGINSYAIDDYSYADYYKDFKLKKKDKVKIIDSYSKKEMSITSLTEKIKTDNKLKEDLNSSNILFLTIGYNDLLYKIKLEENLTNSRLLSITREIDKSYNKLLKEIRKYYKRKIIVVGYFKSNKDDYYVNKGIKELNNILSKNSDVIFIETYNLLNNRKEYFSNPNSYYPNIKGYELIGKSIIDTVK